MVKTDCFAFGENGCKALIRRNCDNCTFYKPKGTECDTCYLKGTEHCKECRLKEI